MKAFISYSHGDKDRFVKDFIERLESNGIEVWWDNELGYGDSLIDIFEKGIDDCDIFFAILSKFSIKSKWVKEEMDAGFIRKIDKSITLVPVILDEDIKIPASLKHIKQMRINIDDYDEEFDFLINSLFNKEDSSSIGRPPKYLLETPINNLNKEDSLVIKVLGDYFLDSPIGKSSVSFKELIGITEEFEIPDNILKESVEILEEKGYLDFTKYLGSDLPENIKLRSLGKAVYCENFIPKLNAFEIEIMDILLNDSLNLSYEIYQRTEIPLFVIEFILEYFSSRNLIEIQRVMDGNGSYLIKNVNASGKRYFREKLSDF